jgi:pimeloyl-ACP methyl ester carboxylesterase
MHGKWHDGSCWDPLTELLGAAGHEVAAPDLPYGDPTTSYDERVQPALDAVARAAGALVIVGHSLATAYAPIVADRLPRSSLVYLCPAPVGPFAIAEAPMRSSQEGFEFPPKRADGTDTWEPEVAISVLYRRLPEAAGRSLARRLRPGASAIDAYPMSTPPDVPTTLIYAAHDEFFQPEWSKWVAQELVGVEPIELDTGHFPMVEAPAAVAEILLRVAG